MKYIKYIMLLATIGFFAACDSDIENVQINNPSAFVAPVIGQCNNVIVNADNSNAESVVFNWSAADFGQPVQILYSLYLTDGTTDAYIGNSSSTSLAVSKGDLNGAILNEMGYPANSSVAVSAYVVAKIADTDMFDSVKSNTSNTFTVETFAQAKKWLFLCGEATNGWDIGNASIFYETAGGSNIYSFMADFNQGTAAGNERSYFKITAEQNWSAANWGYNFLTPSWTCPEQSDSNLSLDLSEGNIFMLTINTSVMTIDHKAIGNMIGLVGSFNGWGESADDAPFVWDYTTNTWKTEPVSLDAGAEIKIRVDQKWDTNWGMTGTISSEVSGGYELEKGAGNIVVSEAGSYVVVFHANRTPYVLELVKQ
ncbi:MAG: SusE domain-containing protein [Phocaeicola sp.]|nr:SusE domain-containing protein [Phocaeicola sp.]